MHAVGQSCPGPINHNRAAPRKAVEVGVGTGLNNPEYRRRRGDKCRSNRARGAMAEYRLISADSHVNEPPDLWVSRVDQKYRERAPQLMVNPPGGKEGAY